MISPIGRGGMGEVWRATDEVLGRAVAVKLLLGDRDDASSAARFRLEAQTAARLSHPHLVAVFDFGAWEDRFYLVMELVEGMSLSDLLATQETVHPEQVARIAGEAAAGLAAAHRQGVVHRDIKPGNLMLDGEGSLKIGDFGIAQFVDDPATALTTAGQIVGTSLYLAPERALGRTADSASDMYSLGCVIYQLLVGHPPFRSDTATATLYQHVDTPPVPLRQRGVDISPAFDAYLLSLLAKQPEDRPGAQQVSDWFRAGAWRGHPEPLPPQVAPAGPVRAPAGPPARTPLTSPVSGGTRRPGPDTAGGSAGPTTYRLPQATGRRRAPAPVRRRSTREAIRRRPRVASAIAGTAAFIAAVYLGMVLFAPDPSSAGTPVGDPTSTTGPETPAGDGASPGVPPSDAPAGDAVPQESVPQEGSPGDEGRDEGHEEGRGGGKDREKDKGHEDD
ncbi:serine/threonine-protein kinase [Streptomyces fulvorobeus]|uniref:non-specific serine/threonine protein kinase n=2 Tax=Streptomyces fulvorobeus TaxID=284028 RepID=A0A7Y9H7S6_9ACTN|nr:serine/threonine-protein kinase [Streptomyces fulvorobeus]